VNLQLISADFWQGGANNPVSSTSSSTQWTSSQALKARYFFPHVQSPSIFGRLNVMLCIYCKIYLLVVMLEMSKFAPCTRVANSSLVVWFLMSVFILFCCSYYRTGVAYWLDAKYAALCWSYILVTLTVL